jgi:hypothetical protein
MGRLGYAVALSLVAATGCDVVWGLEREPPPEFANYDRCGAYLYDEPLRYAQVVNPTGGVDTDGNPLPLLPWSWDDARAACEVRGMDLAVFNDMRELGMSSIESAWPYWIGQRMIGSANETVDGCPAVNTPVSARYVAADVTACGVVGAPLEVDGASCDGALPPGMDSTVVLSALCETPRPDNIDCLGRNPLDQGYIMSATPMSYDAANAFCKSRDAHLLVVETHEEWLFIAKQTKESWEKPFWLGSQFTERTWETVTGCAGTYAWTGNSPGAPKDGSCVAAKLRVVDEAETDLSGTVIDGVEATDCRDEQSYALCELD